MSGPRTNPRPLLLGHRGARMVRTIQENSVASFDRALADGCDGFEFDVRLTSDGEAVLWHDAGFGKRLPRTRRRRERALKWVSGDASHEMGNRVYKKCATKKVADDMIPAHS